MKRPARPTKPVVLAALLAAVVAAATEPKEGTHGKTNIR